MITRSPSTTERMVHVGGLHKQITEDALISALGGQQAGIESVKIAKDLLSNQPLGHARVTFKSRAEAENAITSINRTVLRDMPIQLAFYQPPSERVRYADECKVFIKGIDKEVTDGALLHHLERLSEHIISCKINRDADGASRGYGTAVYASKEAADAAVASVNGTTLSGKPLISMEYHRSRGIAEAQSSGDNYTNLYVKKIDRTLTDQGLGELFQRCGAVKNAKVMVDATGESLGYGFVSFEDHNSAADAVDTFKSSEMLVIPAQNKRTRQVQRARRLEVSSGVTKLIVQNLEDTVTTEELFQCFSEFGTVTFAKVIVDDNGLHRGHGFVHFADPEAASRALAAFDPRQRSKWFVGPLAKKQFRLTMPSDFDDLQPPISAFDGRFFPPRTQSTRLAPPPRTASQSPPPRTESSRRRRSRSRGQNARSPSQARRTLSPRAHRAGSHARPPNQARQTPSPHRAGSPPSGVATSRSASRASRRRRPPSPAAIAAADAAAAGVVDAEAEQRAVEKQLAAAAGDGAKQRQIVGNWIYPSLWERHGEQTAKVVGMLLALDIAEVLKICRDRAAMFAKAQEAATVWQLYNEQLQNHEQ